MPKSRMSRSFKARKGCSTNYALLDRQRNFPKLTCKKNLPVPDVAKKDVEETKVFENTEKNYILKANETVCGFYRTELTSFDTPNNDTLYLVTGALTGAILLTEAEIREYFDLTPMEKDNYAFKDIPYKYTGMKLEYTPESSEN